MWYLGSLYPEREREVRDYSGQSSNSNYQVEQNVV